MFIVSWVFDKLGYMPKVSVDANWPFPAVAKPYTPHEFEVSKNFNPRPKTVKKTKATTRKTTKK